MTTEQDHFVFQYFRKRSGDVVSFDRKKIEKAVQKAAEAAEQTEGTAFQEGIAARVTDQVIEQLDDPLNEYFVFPDEKDRRIPAIEDVQDLVEIVLSEMGMNQIVATYKRYRKQRDLARKRIRVFNAENQNNMDVTDAGLLLVESSTSNVTRPWDRSRIVAQLMEKTDLSIETASSIAKAVENQIIAGDLSTVNSTLVRELVNNELLARGHQTQLRDLSIYRVSRDFVDSLMFTKSTENSNIVNNNPEAVNLGLAELLLKQWALDTIFSPEVKRAHDTGAVHLHDLGYPHRVYCSSHSIEYVKKYGLRDLVNLNTESKPARSASVLTGHLNTFLASMQANYAGALGIAYINIFYAPYLRGMSKADLKQVAQELIFNGSQNAFSRGGQTLFLDFNIHTGIPSYLRKVPAIGAGGHYMLRNQDGEFVELEEKLLDETDAEGNRLMALYVDDNGEKRLVLRECYDEKQGLSYDRNVEQDLAKRAEAIVTYSEFEKEARDFCSALLEVWKEGDRHGRVFEFPKCDFHISEETFRDPAQFAIFQEACELAGHNGSTYFIFDRDEVTLSACCRLRTTITDNRMLLHPESMRFCGFQNVTINVPQAAYRAARTDKTCSLQTVLDEIDRTMEIAVEAHIQKRDKTEEMMSERGRPLYQIGRQACDGRPYVELDKCTYILGLLGVNDAVKFLTGDELHESEKAMDMALHICSHMYLKAKKLSKKHKIKLTLEESPAESAARRLAKTDLVYYPEESNDIVKGGDPDVAYYTNSIHLAAEADVSLVERIRLQSRFHSLIESGAITHAFVGEERPSAQVIATLVQNVLYRTQSAQLTISPEFTYCNTCQHNMRGLLEQCDQCGSEDIVGETRVVGYFSKVQNWNKSKRYGELIARQKGRYSIETASGPSDEKPLKEAVSTI